jgi:hypothetical protein
MEPENERHTITLSGTHGETLTITNDFEPHGLLDGELLVQVKGPKGASKYQFTISRQELARLRWARTAEDGSQPAADPAASDYEDRFVTIRLSAPPTASDGDIVHIVTDAIPAAHSPWVTEIT